MFVRFRQQGRRLQMSLMRTWRAEGRMMTEQVASLGSVDAGVSVRERIALSGRAKMLLIHAIRSVRPPGPRWDVGRTPSFGFARGAWFRGVSRGEAR